MSFKILRFHAPCAVVLLLAAALPAVSVARPRHAAQPQTQVSIVGDEFYINGQPTYDGRTWQGHKIAGLLFNSRMVQGIFDDSNPATVARWNYPDTGHWDPDRNTREFIAAMPSWRSHGLLAFTINLQGGSPEGYSKQQPWQNSAFTPTGALRPAYMARLQRILNRANQLGMVAIVGYFYKGQEKVFPNDAAILRATDNATRWLLRHNFRNVLVEVDNECDVGFNHAILGPGQVAELIRRVQSIHSHGRRLLVSASFRGGAIPTPSVVRAADFLLLHGNGVSHPQRIGQMVQQTRAVPGYTPKPILFNEDDHYNFSQPLNNMTAALAAYASWGFFDYRRTGESFSQGYQSVPVDWTIDDARKRGFFNLLKEVTGE